MRGEGKRGCENREERMVEKKKERKRGGERNGRKGEG